MALRMYENYKPARLVEYFDEQNHLATLLLEKNKNIPMATWPDEDRNNYALYTQRMRGIVEEQTFRADAKRKDRNK